MLEEFQRLFFVRAAQNVSNLLQDLLLFQHLRGDFLKACLQHLGLFIHSVKRLRRRRVECVHAVTDPVHAADKRGE